MDPAARRDADVGSIVAQLCEEISQLRREVSGLRCEVGYWKSRHADTLKRNEKLERELNQARAQIKNLKADLFGRKSEKQSSRDRSNHLEDPPEEDARNRLLRSRLYSRNGDSNRIDPARNAETIRSFRSARKPLSCRRSHASAVVAASRWPNIPGPKTPSNWRSRSRFFAVGCGGSAIKKLAIAPADER